MDIQIQILIFVRSIRVGNFILFTHVLRKLMKWYFIFEHVHYARWLSVHLFDLLTLHVKYPVVYSYLLRGSFAFQKSSKEFSRIALDQVHEQNNRTIKTTGGTNLMNKFDSPLIRWETCGADIARLVLEFEDSIYHAKPRSSSSSKKIPPRRL